MRGSPRARRGRSALRRPLAALALAALAALAPGPAGAAAPARPSYGGDDPPVPLVPAETRALALARPRLAGGGAGPRTSGTLVRAARELARLAADGAPDPLARARVRGALARALSFDAAPVAVLAQGTPDEAPAALARALPRGPATHVGVGAVERDGTVHLVLLASERLARLGAFPRDVAPGSSESLSGSLARGADHARVFVLLPSGLVHEAGATGGSAFRAAIAFPAPGRYSVEVVAEGPGGPEVAALLTVSAGGAPLDPPRGASRRAPADPPDDASAEAAVVDAIAATRGRHGLSALRRAPDLDAVARRHSAAMAAAGRVAHVLPGAGDAGERLRRAGVAYLRAYENVARAATALGAHEAAEESPAHLGNVLRSDAARVGVGIARVRLASGETSVYLTEILVAPPDDGAASPLTPDARVREALWRERARLGLPPLTSDAALDALARESAGDMRARDETEAPDLARRALALGRTLAAVDVFVASAPSDAVRSANVRDRRFRRVGVGVAPGDSRRFGAARLWIAVVYAD